MNPATKFWLASYGCLACAHLGAKWWEFRVISYATKPLLMALLIAYFRYAWHHAHTAFTGFLMWGLAWALLGDVFMMLAEILRHDGFYLCGMGAFFVTHACYIAGFARYPSTERGLLAVKPWLVLPVLGYLALALWYLLPGVPSHLLVPTVVYGLVLALMALACLHLAGKMSFAAWYQMFGGVALFMLSDTMIAITKHRFAIPSAGFWIMLTYLLGQYLIVEGSLAAQRKKDPLHF